MKSTSDKIFFCEACKSYSNKKEELRHKLTCRYETNRKYNIIEFKGLWEFIDYYDKKIFLLEHDVAHHKILDNQTRNWYRKNLKDLKGIIDNAIEDFDDWEGK